MRTGGTKWMGSSSTWGFLPCNWIIPGGDFRLKPTHRWICVSIHVIRLPRSPWLNSLPEEELAEILWKYGEERQSRRIAKAICSSRPVKTTGELAAIVRRSLGTSHGRIDPATRTFQAIRIAVNMELRAIDEALPRALEALKPGGRLAVISFHSLEDRLVKQFIRRESSDCICPPGQPVCTCGHVASLKDLIPERYYRLR